MAAKKKTHTKRPSTIARETALRAEYERLSNIKQNGVQKYSHQWILMQLNSKFYYSINTIEKKLQQLS